MIHVCYALRDESGRYSKFAGTSIESLLENTREPVTIHILHDSTLSKENRRKLVSIAYRFNQEILFYNVDNLARDLIDEANSRMSRIHGYWGSIAVLYRPMILAILPETISRVIVLDTDLIINLDINELWQIDLKGKSLAAVTEFDAGLSLEKATDVTPCKKNLVKPENYFNAGVFLMDLKKISKFGGGGATFIQTLPRYFATESRLQILRSRRAQRHIPRRFFKASGKIQQHPLSSGKRSTD